MGFFDYVFMALGFESKGKRAKKKVPKTKATFKLKDDSYKRVEQIDGVPVYYPENLQQAKEFCQFLTEQKAVILSLEMLSREEQERCEDFYGGAVIGLGAKMRKLNNMLVLLPEGMEIEE